MIDARPASSRVYRQDHARPQAGDRSFDQLTQAKSGDQARAWRIDDRAVRLATPCCTWPSAAIPGIPGPCVAFVAGWRGRWRPPIAPCAACRKTATAARPGDAALDSPRLVVRCAGGRGAGRGCHRLALPLSQLASLDPRQRRAATVPRRRGGLYLATNRQADCRSGTIGLCDGDPVIVRPTPPAAAELGRRRCVPIGGRRPGRGGVPARGRACGSPGRAGVSRRPADRT